MTIERNAEIPTWFGVGGGADLLARPSTAEELRRLLDEHARVRMLGDGANLLVGDEGVDGLVVSLERMARVIEVPDEPGVLCVEAGVNLPRLIVETARQGFAGLETLGGIPASIGGAVRMNAGGAFGQIADVVERVHIYDESRRERTLTRDEIAFDYRRSGLEQCVIAAAEVRLTPEDPAKVRERLKEVMEYKKKSQPMADKSAGCVFKNPVVDGERESAGRLIDKAGLKGLRVGGAEVSHVHANFIVTHPGCGAADVLILIEEIQRRVTDVHGIELETEVVIWRRGGGQ